MTAEQCMKPEMWYPEDIFDYDQIKCDFNSLRFVTDTDFSEDQAFQSDQLEQVALMCPNLKRLGLSTISLNSLQGLRTVATCCHNLQGLNLLRIPVTEVENQLQLWKILSNLKLTHLALEMCIMRPLRDDSIYMQRLISLFQNFIHLLALHLAPSFRDCPNCDDCIDHDISVTSHPWCIVSWVGWNWVLPLYRISPAIVQS